MGMSVIFLLRYWRWRNTKITKRRLPALSSWLPAAGHRIVLKYTDLIAEPAMVAMKTLRALSLDIQPRALAVPVGRARL